MFGQPTSRRSLVTGGVTLLIFAALLLIISMSFTQDRDLDAQAAAGAGAPGTFEVVEIRSLRFASDIPYGTWTGDDGGTAYGRWRGQAGEPRVEVGDVVPGQLLWRGDDAVVYPLGFTAGDFDWDLRLIGSAALGGLVAAVGVGCLVAAPRVGRAERGA